MKYDINNNECGLNFRSELKYVVEYCLLHGLPLPDFENLAETLDLDYEQKK